MVCVFTHIPKTKTIDKDYFKIVLTLSIVPPIFAQGMHSVDEKFEQCLQKFNALLAVSIQATTL